MRLLISYRTVALVILNVLLAGCVAGGPSPSPRLYLLSPMDPDKAALPADTGKSTAIIALASVQLPEYLARPQMVTRGESSRLVLAEFDRWAEPLRGQLYQVMAENLTHLLSIHQIQVDLWRGTAPVDYKLEIRVIQLDGQLGEAVTLIARWVLFNKKNGQQVRMNRFHIKEPVSADDYKALVVAHNRAIYKLSQHIAAEIGTQIEP